MKCIFDRTVFIVAAIDILGWLTGCATYQDSPKPPRAEASVRPGINKEYLKPDINAQQWVERFEKEGREVFDQRQKIIDTIGLKPGMSVADIGAGTGLFTPLLAEKVGPSGKVYAVDIVQSFLTLIAKRMSDAGVRNVKTVLCTERSVELPANSIDVAYICDVYHHFEYPQHSLASIRKALKPGGQIILVEFKRIEGVSSEWALNHVRAGQEVFEKEIQQAGFAKVAQYDFMKDNYVVRFRKN